MATRREPSWMKVLPVLLILPTLQTRADLLLIFIDLQYFPIK